MPIQLTLEGTHLKIEGNDPLRTRYERTELSYRVYDGETFVRLFFEDNQIAKLFVGDVLDETATPFVDLTAIVDFLSIVCDSATESASAGGGTGLTVADVTSGINAASITTNVGTASDLAGDPTLIGLLKQVEANTAGIEITLDGTQITIDNVDANTDELEQLLRDNLSIQSLRSGTSNLLNKSTFVDNSNATDPGVFVTTLSSLASFYCANNGNTSEHWLGIIADGAAPVGGETFLTAFKIGSQVDFAILIDRQTLMNYGVSTTGYRLVRSSTPTIYTSVTLNGDNYLSATFNIV